MRMWIIKTSQQSYYKDPIFKKIFIYIFIYLVALGLSCSMRAKILFWMSKPAYKLLFLFSSWATIQPHFLSRLPVMASGCLALFRVKVRCEEHDKKRALIFYLKWILPETSLVGQWLRLCASNAGAVDWIPGWGTKIPHASSGQKKKKKKTTSIKQVCIYLSLAYLRQKHSNYAHCFVPSFLL